MKKQYNVLTVTREAKARSKRLQKVGISGGSVNVNMNTSSVSGDGHTHENLLTLDKISIDDDNYLYLKTSVLDDDSGEVVNIDEKVKAGYSDAAAYSDEAAHANKAAYADIAHDLDIDSPVNERFLRKDQADSTDYLLELNGGVIVRSSKTASQFHSVLSDGLIEEDSMGMSANVIEESDDDSQPLSVALIEVPASDGATTLGGLRNVDDTADTFSDTDDMLVRKAGTKEWAVERLIRSGWIPVNTTSERDALDTSYLLKGCVCYVFNEDALYKWTGTAWEKKELGGGGSTGIQRNVRITNNLDSKNISASKGEPCLLKFTFVSQERYDSGEAYEDTGERGVCLISVKSSNSDEYAVVKQLPVNSAVPTTIDVAEFLTSGVNNVMIKVTGTVTEVTTPAFVYTVQLTSLSVDAGNFKWWTAYTGNVTLPLYIGGNVSKTLYVNISGTDYNESYEVALGTSVYVETAYNYAIPHPGKTGVFRIGLCSVFQVLL